jgi:hypothetical protein
MVPSIVTLVLVVQVAAEADIGATDRASSDAIANAANVVAFFIRFCPFYNKLLD